MHQQQIRAFNPRTLSLGIKRPGVIRARQIRGYDGKGALLFTAPANTAGRDSARAALDQRTIKDRKARYGERFVRCEIDNLMGGHAELVVLADGSTKKSWVVDGEIVAF